MWHHFGSLIFVTPLTCFWRFAFLLCQQKCHSRQFTLQDVCWRSNGYFKSCKSFLVLLYLNQELQIEDSENTHMTKKSVPSFSVRVSARAAKSRARASTLKRHLRGLIIIVEPQTSKSWETIIRHVIFHHFFCKTIKPLSFLFILGGPTCRTTTHRPFPWR